MLSFTSDELNREDYELLIGFRGSIAGIIQDNQRQVFINKSQEYIQLANNLRNHYIPKEKTNAQVIKDNEHLLRLFETLEASGVMKEIMGGKENDATE